MSTKTSNGNGHAKSTTHPHAATPEPRAETKASTRASPLSTPAAAKSGTQSASNIAPQGPTSAQIEAMLDQLDAMASQFGGGTPLTIAERRRLLKIRPGGDEHASTVVKLADRYGLTIPGVNTADVMANIALAQDIAPLISRFETMLGLATDVSLGAKSNIWRSGTKAYSMLARIVPEYPALQRELTPMASFLATKHKDAPTTLRTQEKTSLDKSRDTLKTKKKTSGAGAPSSSEPSTATATTTAEPATPQATTQPTAQTADQPKVGA
jgi:hypothetical protein